MSIPDFETLMLPLLQSFRDGREQNVANLVDDLSQELRLSPKEQTELIPSGREPKLQNRVKWALHYLINAGLVERTRRGWYRLSQQGTEVLSTTPSRIDRKFLAQFPEYQAALSRPRPVRDTPQSAIPSYQSLMLPLLKLTKAGQEHSFGETTRVLGRQLLVSPRVLDERNSSGKRTRFGTRVGWALHYLVKAGLIERSGWGKFRITARGIELLASKPEEIDFRMLMQFPEFQQFKASRRNAYRSPHLSARRENKMVPLR